MWQSILLGNQQREFIQAVLKWKKKKKKSQLFQKNNRQTEIKAQGSEQMPLTAWQQICEVPYSNDHHLQQRGSSTKIAYVDLTLWFTRSKLNPLQVEVEAC